MATNFQKQYNQAFRKSEWSTHDGIDDTHVSSKCFEHSLFMLEEKCQGVEVFHAKDLEKYTWKFSQNMEFNMNLIHHGLPPHWFQIMIILKSVI